MNIFKKNENKLVSVNFFMALILGILVVAVFMLIQWNYKLQNEITKLKSDDLILAQAINRLLNQAGDLIGDKN